MKEVKSVGYDNIMNLAKEHGLKKIMVMRNTWGFGSWCIVNKVVFKPNGYGSAYGYITEIPTMGRSNVLGTMCGA